MISVPYSTFRTPPAHAVLRDHALQERARRPCFAIMHCRNWPSNETEEKNQTSTTLRAVRASRSCIAGIGRQTEEKNQTIPFYLVPVQLPDSFFRISRRVEFDKPKSFLRLRVEIQGDVHVPHVRHVLEQACWGKNALNVSTVHGTTRRSSRIYSPLGCRFSYVGVGSDGLNGERWGRRNILPNLEKLSKHGY